MGMGLPEVLRVGATDGIGGWGSTAGRHYEFAPGQSEWWQPLPPGGTSVTSVPFAPHGRAIGTESANSLPRGWGTGTKSATSPPRGWATGTKSATSAPNGCGSAGLTSALVVPNHGAIGESTLLAPHCRAAGAK